MEAPPDDIEAVRLWGRSSIPDVLSYQNGLIIPEHMKYVDHGEQVRMPYHTDRSRTEARAFELQRFGRIGSEGNPYPATDVSFGDASLLITALLAIVAAGYARYTTVERTIEDLKNDPHDIQILKNAQDYVETFKIIPEVRAAHRQRAAASELNDLGAGGSTTGATSLGEPYWTSKQRRVNNMIASTTGTKRRPANHNFSGGKVQRSLQAFSGHHTLERM